MDHQGESSWQCCAVHQYLLSSSQSKEESDTREQRLHQAKYHTTDSQGYVSLHNPAKALLVIDL